MSADDLKSRVFVVQESRYVKDGSTVSHDYTSIYRYGQVIFLLPGSRKHIEESGKTELQMLQEKLADFVPARDYLVFSGDPVLCAQAAVVAVLTTDERVTKIQVLKWHRQSDSYIPTSFDLPGVSNG